MYNMWRKAAKTATAATLSLFLVLSSGAWAVLPDDALTGRPNSSFRFKIRLDGLKNIKNIFDHPAIGLYSAILKEGKTGGIMYALNLAFELNPQSIEFIIGTDAGQQFLQMAVSMPKTALPQLYLIELGIATKAEMNEFLTGESRKSLNPMISEGTNGPYYLFKDTVFLAARENLLIIALSLEDLDASLNALDKAGVKRCI